MSVLGNHVFAIAVDATNWSYYVGGVFSQCSYNINHAVVVVGYNYTTSSSWSTTNYWLVRNSWGTSWGLSGFMHLSMGKSTNTRGTCGMKMYPPAYPLPL